jgi:hypothetical protein
MTCYRGSVLVHAERVCGSSRAPYCFDGTVTLTTNGIYKQARILPYAATNNAVVLCR